MSPDTHASTGGGYRRDRSRSPARWRGDPDVEVNRTYMDRARTDQASFNKVVSTLRHEDVHIEQRRSQRFMEISSKAEREFLAYSEELRPSSRFPDLEGTHRDSTIHKMREEFHDMPYDKRSFYRPIYSAASHGGDERQRQSAWGRLGQFNPGSHPLDLPRHRRDEGFT